MCAGDNWGFHEELHVALCSIQKYISTLGSSRVSQASALVFAINHNYLNTIYIAFKYVVCKYNLSISIPLYLSPSICFLSSFLEQHDTPSCNVKYYYKRK